MTRNTKIPVCRNVGKPEFTQMNVNENRKPVKLPMDVKQQSIKLLTRGETL